MRKIVKDEKINSEFINCIILILNKKQMITRTARSLLKLNSAIVGFGFCVNKALLDPYKHTTMSHSPHNMFVDLYDFGQYPEVIAPASIPARTYQPVVVGTIVDMLNARYGTSLTVDDFNSKLDKTWTRFIQKDLNSQDNFNEVVSPILNKLAVNIFVRESRWTWVKEQRVRLNASARFFTKKNKPETLGDFLNRYNVMVQSLVLASTFGLSPHIPQAPTPLEKHYVQEMSDSVHEGVEELNNLEGDNNNIINRFMGWIHKL